MRAKLANDRDDFLGKLESSILIKKFPKGFCQFCDLRKKYKKTSWNTHWTRQEDILNFAGRHFWKTIYHNWTWKRGSKRFEVTFYLQQVNLRDLGSKIDLPPFSVAVSKHWRHKFRKKYINSDNFWTMQINRIILDYSVKTMDESQKGSFWLKMTEWPVSRFVLSCMWSQILLEGNVGR